MNRILLGGLALLACLMSFGFPGAASAATRTASISVSATVVSTCSVSSSGVAGMGCASNKPVESSCTINAGAALGRGAVSVDDCGIQAPSRNTIAQDAQAHVLVTTIVF
jgi:hypothetical protein